MKSLIAALARSWLEKHEFESLFAGGGIVKAPTNRTPILPMILGVADNDAEEGEIVVVTLKGTADAGDTHKGFEKTIHAHTGYARTP